MRLDILRSLNAERAARRGAIVVTDVATGDQRFVSAADVAADPLREVLEGKRVLLVEDTIVRSTTMKTLLADLKVRGGAREIHVRVACPPIVAPCFYGIDMSTVRELFAPRFLKGAEPTAAEQAAMAAELGADSLSYLPLEAVARCIGLPPERLCRACLTGQYPTEMGEQLYQVALRNRNAESNGRTYEATAETKA